MLKKDKKYTFIDLFAGCGGLTEGFLESNKFAALAHVEWETPMINTMRHRLETKWKHTSLEAKQKSIHFDIQKTEELIHGLWKDDTKRVYGKDNDDLVINKGINGLVKNQKIDAIIGGPPCQAYSIAGRAQDKNSMKDDYRNYLFESFATMVEYYKPDFFVFENVPGILSASPGGILVTERIYDEFSNINYEIPTSKQLKKYIFDSSDFGVPQKRRRVIIIGVNKSSNLNLEEIYSSINKLKSKDKVYVKDAIGHLPKFKPLKDSKKENGKNISHKKVSKENVFQHQPRFHNTRDIEIFKKWLENDMNNKPSNERIDFYNDIMGKQSNHAKYRNLEWNKLSPTIVAHLYKDGLMFIHPDKEQARSITVKEAALLQSFPNDFEFIGSNGACYKMIGNAVPPKMAEKIALGIANYLNGVK
jgi:DNA (cytosine-5)-methyltransferase 1